MCTTSSEGCFKNRELGTFPRPYRIKLLEISRPRGCCQSFLLLRKRTVQHTVKSLFVRHDFEWAYHNACAGPPLVFCVTLLYTTLIKMHSLKAAGLIGFPLWARGVAHLFGKRKVNISIDTLALLREYCIQPMECVSKSKRDINISMSFLYAFSRPHKSQESSTNSCPDRVPLHAFWFLFDR